MFVPMPVGAIHELCHCCTSLANQSSFPDAKPDKTENCLDCRDWT